MPTWSEPFLAIVPSSMEDNVDMMRPASLVLYSSKTKKNTIMKRKKKHSTKIKCSQTPNNNQLFLMSTPIPFPSDAVTMLPDGIVARSCKCKQAFSLNDPDNIEVVQLATQAAKKKAKLSKLNSSEKKMTNQKSGSKSNCQPSIEEVKDIDNMYVTLCLPMEPQKYPRVK